jgi:cytochrome c5
MSLIIFLTNIHIASGQAGKELASPIPENINKILQTSCSSCHGTNGGMMPLAKLNLSKWTDYNAAKGAEKASKICAVLTEGSMPPKSFRKSNPELVPSKDQVGLICKWAESIKPIESGK